MEVQIINSNNLSLWTYCEHNIVISYLIVSQMGLQGKKIVLAMS